VTGVRVVSSDGSLDFTDAKLASDGRSFNQRDYRYKEDAASVARTGDPNATDMERRPPTEWRGPDTIYYISYRWRDTNDTTLTDDERVQGVIDEQMVMPPSGSDPYFRVFMGTTPDKDVIDGEVGVRVKRLIGPARVDPGTLAQREGDSIRGYVALPASVPEDLRTESSDPETLGYSDVSLNYTVRDWRWLVDDDTPDREGLVTTPIRFYDSEPLAQLTPALADPLTPVYSLLTFTNDSGSVRYTRTAPGKWDDDPSTPGGRILDDVGDDKGVDRKLGKIRYDVTPPDAGFSAPRARTVYWTLDGWAQQISVAARSYLPYVEDRPGREEWREYYWEGNQAAKASAVTQEGRGVIYFPPSESGKSVLVTFEHLDGTEYKTQSSVLTISDKFDGLNSPTTVAKLNTAWPMMPTIGAQARKAEFRNPATGGLYDVRAILSVQGLSVQSRTAWIENNARYTQAEAAGYRKLD
jgi:hypothetical protein